MMMPLETDLLESSSSESNDNGELTLRVQQSTIHNVDVKVSKGATVSELKGVVMDALGSTENRYLRLICKGRLLAPDAAPIADFSLQQGDVLHAVLAAAGVRGGQQAALARGTTRRLRGTGVGPSGRIARSTAGESDDSSQGEDASDDEEEGRERLGFDRLRSSGLSRQEITAIRAYFSRQVDRYVQDHPNTHEEETDGLRRRLLQEDAWMQAQGPASEFRLNLNQNSAPLTLFPTRVGTDRDFLYGFMMGFFVGLLMLVWVWMPTVPHKQKLGILTGISLQLALSLLKHQESVDLDD